MNNFSNKKVLKNTVWLIGCRIIQAILGFIISMLTARFLGPANFGLISYAASIVAFFSPIMKLGLDFIMVQEIVNNPDQEDKIVGTGLSMNLVCALLCIIGVISFALVANSGEKETLIICTLYSFTLIAQATEMIMYWFHAKLMSKYVSLVSLFAYFIVSIYKIFLLLNHQKVYFFALSYTIDYLIIGIILFIIRKKITQKNLEFSYDWMKKLFSRGKYYIISGLMIVIYGQTDKIMLKMMLDESAVGYYSAGVTCVAATSFIFSAVITSMQPVIFEGKKIGKEIFEKRITQLYSIVIYCSLVQSVIFTFFSDFIVNILYGVQYSATVSVLNIIAWYTAFSYYGAAKDVWILAENKQKYLIILNGAGAIVNILLNFFLIPIFGTNGAAIASLITQFFTNIIMGIVIKDLRENNKLLINSLNPKHVLDFVNAIIKK